MNSLVLELQKDSLNPSVSILNLLRKALVVATKLDLQNFQTWIQHELNGYADAGEDIPKYRFVQGQLIGRNPFHGWQPVISGDEQTSEIYEMVCNHPIPQPISELLDLTEKNESTLHICFPSEVERFLMSGIGRDIPIRLSVSCSSFQRILETVRDTILRWALSLEKDGILGEEMSFSEQEKVRAANQDNQIVINNIFGDHSMTNQNNDFRNSTIGGGIAGRDYMGNVIHDYAEKQNLAEAAADIQQLLKQLERSHPTVTLTDKAVVAEEAIKQIESNPNLKARVIGLLQSAGVEAFKEAVDHPLVNILVAGIEGWQKGN